MASDPFGAVLLLGLGYRRLSVSPPAIPLIKWVIRNVPASAARAAAGQALEATDAAGVTAAIRDGISSHVDLRIVSPL
jgi:signal transduction protein with GAF and PtsI domain